MALLLVSSPKPYDLILYEKSIEKSIGLWFIYIKASSNFACGEVTNPVEIVKVQIINVQDCTCINTYIKLVV